MRAGICYIRSKPIEIPAILERLYSYAWFVSFGVAFGVYLVGMTVLFEARSASKGLRLEPLLAPRAPHRFPVFQIGSCCDSLADANQRVIVIFCCV